MATPEVKVDRDIELANLQANREPEYDRIEVEVRLTATVRSPKELRSVLLNAISLATRKLSGNAQTSDETERSELDLTQTLDPGGPEREGAAPPRDVSDPEPAKRPDGTPLYQR